MKLIALAPQFYINDTTITYVKQKLFKLNEAIEIYNDDSKSTLIYTIGADRVIDFSACYHFNNLQTNIGSTKCYGLESIWRTHFDVMDNQNNVKYTIALSSPMAQFIEGVLLFLFWELCLQL